LNVTFQPGDLVRGFAALYGWPIKPRSILVEGEHDQRYFGVADRLYAAETGLQLIGNKLAIFPTGIGDEGGAFGLQKHFHPLRAIMDRDVDRDGHKVFHAIALFDSDLEGRRGFAALSGRHLSYRKWRDIFLLERCLPRTTRDSAQLEKLVATTNVPWKGMDCEIEDLVSPDISECFLQENPNAVFRTNEERAGGMHYFFRPQYKSKLVKYVEDYALLADVQRVVEVLKSLRFYVGLPPDGELER